METAFRKEALRIAARFLERIINADRSDHAGPVRACVFCGQEARYTGQRPRRFVTTLGDISITARAYYLCPSCGRGWCPKDDALGFGGSSLSPGVTRMVSLVASAGSFCEGSKLLFELAGVNVSEKSVERTAEKVGRAIAADDRAVVRETRRCSDTVYAGVDGTGIPMRPDELAGRAGKQLDGSAKTREVKQCSVWTADSRDNKGNPVRDRGSVTYSAGIESCSWNRAGVGDQVPVFAGRVERELTRTGFFLAQRQVFIGDGAPWIWNLADMITPEAIQIVDLYHAKEHLSLLAGLIFGPGTDLSAKWAEEQHHYLESGQMDRVLTAIGCHKDRPGPLGAKVALEYGYFSTNRKRMRYDQFRSMGLCVGSGVVEAGCRTVIGQRLKRSGMFWSVDGANAIIALRCCLLSNRFDDFWARYKPMMLNRPA